MHLNSISAHSFVEMPSPNYTDNYTDNENGKNRSDKFILDSLKKMVKYNFSAKKLRFD